MGFTLLAPEHHAKTPSESYPFQFVFKKFALGEVALSSPAPIITVSPITVPPLMLSEVIVFADSVQARISEGTDNTTYTITCEVSTNQGNTKDCIGQLTVIETAEH
jgi:hypothetical protein